MRGRAARHPAALIAALAVSLATGCGGGGGSPPAGAEAPGPVPCDGGCATAASFLTVADVERVIAQGAAEAGARGVPATIAVVDRVGNVLGVFRMSGAPATVTITSGSAVAGGLEGVDIVPAALAAIAKAITGAYLSSEGNAFSTRTASQIIQEHFNPGEQLAPGGPLFGVQFSQLPCSDLAGRWTGGAPDAGPKRSPLGLSADPGGFPLFKAGTPVGGVGVVADGIYGLDRDVSDRDLDPDELVALAASWGFAAPADRRAERITADGKTLRFSDADFGDLQSEPASAPPFAAVDGVQGALSGVAGYTNAAIQPGVAFGQAPSGVRPDVADFPGLDAFVLVDGADAPRFAPAAGSEPAGALTTGEVRELLDQALRVAGRARAQIRRPLSSSARVTVSVVDSSGGVLGIARGRDAPVFGIDVSLQKARTAALLSSAGAGAAVAAVPDAVYLDGGLSVLASSTPAAYLTAAQGFLGLPGAFTDGAVAFPARSIGNLARPFYPDGVDGRDPGPFSKAFADWSVFSTGLQLDLVYNALVQHVGFVLGAGPDVAQNCTGVSGFDSGFAAVAPIAGLANGLQIFPGGVPVYRGSALVGAVGVSGDGVDQDDMIAFLGVAEAGRLLGTLANAPPVMRADTLTPAGARLRYVNCPQAPFLDSTEQEACSGE
ncbi:MAG: heme-binding protein [Gammaproteobacteria bacterium]